MIILQVKVLSYNLNNLIRRIDFRNSVNSSRIEIYDENNLIDYRFL